MEAHYHRDPGLMTYDQFRSRLEQMYQQLARRSGAGPETPGDWFARQLGQSPEAAAAPDPFAALVQGGFGERGSPSP